MKKWKFRKLGRLFLGLAVIIGAVISVLTLTGTNEVLRKYLAGFFIVLISLFSVSTLIDTEIGSDIASESGANLVTVIRVIDGDSIIVDRDIEVRLIGIDAPESGECFFQESRDALIELINGKNVELKKDISGMDDFGRLLGYVFLPSDSEYEDEIFVNQYLLEQGYADVLPLGQDMAYRRFLTSSRNQAITKRKGIWEACENQEEKAETIFPLEKNNSPIDSKCLIKGNISEHGYGRTYFSPGDPNYESVKISFNKGEQYFCTKEEAEAAGYKKASTSY